MTTAAKVQSKLNRGAAIAARHLGTPYRWYRPAGTGNPLMNAHLVDTINVDIKADFGFMGARPNLYGKPVFAALFDWSLSRPGDYLNGDMGVFFIATQQINVPAAVVSCNHTVKIIRPGTDTPGTAYYGGSYDVAEQTLCTDWPVSILESGRGGVGDTGLPSDVRLSRFAALVPPSFTEILRSSDVIIDNYQRRFTVSGTEATDLGWRVFCDLTVT